LIFLIFSWILQLFLLIFCFFSQHIQYLNNVPHVPLLKAMPKGLFYLYPTARAPQGAYLAFLQKTQTSLAKQASLPKATSLAPLGASFTKAYKYPLSHLLLYATQKPSRALAPEERKRLHLCRRRVQARRGCIRKDAPAGAGRTDKYAIPPFLCTPPRGQKRARSGDAAPPCAKRKA